MTTGARLGGRSARVVEAVVEATLEELGRVGFAALRIEDIAARSGVNKTTIYRRWTTKAELVKSVLGTAARLDMIPDTGTVRGDLVAMFAAALEWFQSPLGRGLARLVQVEKASDREVMALVMALRAELLALRTAAITRGVARGELPAGTDAALVARTIHAAIFSRLVLFDERVTHAEVEAVIDLVLAGARAVAAPLLAKKAVARKRPRD